VIAEITIGPRQIIARSSSTRKPIDMIFSAGIRHNHLSISLLYRGAYSANSCGGAFSSQNLPSSFRANAGKLPDAHDIWADCDEIGAGLISVRGPDIVCTVRFVRALRPTKEHLPMLWRLSCLIVGWITVAAVSTSDAKVLRNKYNSQTVWIFNDADALRRFNKPRSSAVYDESVVAPLLRCKAPQGSKIEVLGSGYRTAFVRIVDGSANGCEGTVPIGNVRDQ
jgi:hypothetical protein